MEILWRSLRITHWSSRSTRELGPLFTSHFPQAFWESRPHEIRFSGGVASKLECKPHISAWRRFSCDTIQSLHPTRLPEETVTRIVTMGAKVTFTFSIAENKYDRLASVGCIIYTDWNAGRYMFQSESGKLFHSYWKESRLTRVIEVSIWAKENYFTGE